MSPLRNLVTLMLAEITNWSQRRQTGRTLRQTIGRYPRLKRAAQYIGPRKMVERRRYRQACRYLNGEGLEIGALYSPLKVPPGTRVRYVDCATRDQSIRAFPELDPTTIVKPDFVEDGFALPSVPTASQSFVITCHVLEHSSNTLQALENWWRVLKPGGVLFIVVPLCNHTFDRGRTVTTVAHMADDYEAYRIGAAELLAERNLPHYLEWVTISEPNLGGVPCPSPAEAETLARNMAAQNGEIHFHTFSVDSFRELLEMFAARNQTASTVLDVVALGSEVLGVVRKEMVVIP